MILTGPSGSGKSTLFRAIAGIWPFGAAGSTAPRDASVMLLPQRPYLPLGTLRGALAYPGERRTRSRTPTIADAMQAVGLEHLAARLDDVAIWTQALSGGEQQRVAIVRALLKRPDWLFLDEATAALDEPMEARIYAMLRERLPGTTIVSIGHRTTLLAFHDRHLEMRPGPDGVFTPFESRDAGRRGARGLSCGGAQPRTSASSSGSSTTLSCSLGSVRAMTAVHRLASDGSPAGAARRRGCRRCRRRARSSAARAGRRTTSRLSPLST